MKKIFLIVGLLALLPLLIIGSGCEKEKRFQVLFYTDAFVNINTPIDSVVVYVDNHYIGTLLKSPMSEQDFSIEKRNIVTKQIPTGTHSYLAKVYERNGNTSRYWKSEFKIESQDFKIKLSSSTLNN